MKKRTAVIVGDKVRFVHKGWWAVGTIVEFEDVVYAGTCPVIKFDYSSQNTTEGEVVLINRRPSSLRPMTAKGLEQHEKRMAQYKKTGSYWSRL